MSLMILEIKKLMNQNKSDTSIQYKSYFTSFCEQIKNYMNTNKNI